MSKTINFKIVLIESNPIIWRNFKISEDFRLDRFHQVLQIVMGWTNSHLHEFKINGELIGMIDEWSTEYSPLMKDETKLYLRDYNFEEKDTFSYTYDFGDGWSHVLYVVNISHEKLLIPECLDGKRACPPEDCGGVWGYSNTLEILKDSSHSEYDEHIEWLPEGFHPDHLSIENINLELQRFGMWHNQHPRKKSTPWHQI